MFKMPGITQETLDMLKQAKPQDLALLQKAFNQSLGLVWYDLEPTAKLLYPVITPLRNMIPRVSGAGGTAVNWKQITAVNANKQSAGVSEGNRTARITTTAANKNATYKGLGLEDSVSFEADNKLLKADNEALKKKVEELSKAPEPPKGAKMDVPTAVAKQDDGVRKSDGLNAEKDPLASLKKAHQNPIPFAVTRPIEIEKLSVTSEPKEPPIAQG